MEIIIDIETLPGDLSKREEDMSEVAESTKLSCNLTKGAIVEQLGDPQLKYKTLEELKPIWIGANKEKAVEQAYRKRALDGTYGQVCSVAVSGANINGINSISLAEARDEAAILCWVSDIMVEYLGRKDGKNTTPFFIGHNITFDLKFLFRRFVVNRLAPGFKLPFGGWHGKDFYCTLQGWCGRDGRISQDNLCKALGIEGKPEGISGSNVYDHALEGNWEGIEGYNRDDVKKCKEIYKRLTK